jgi:CDP-paratose 2-epimerase
MQVRDILHIDDLVNAYQLAIKNNKLSRGQIYNIGGGIENSISLLELITILQSKISYKIRMKYYNWREGDQKIYISDNSKLEKELNWKPVINKLKGIDKLVNWAKSLD